MQSTGINKANFCFCTLALGKEYRDLALLLLQDIAVYAKGINFVILTDQPKDFRNYDHVQVFKHNQKSVGCYQDKVYVISQALSLFNSCMFMDADMRILQDFPQFQWSPGITARSCSSIKHHFSTQVKNVVARNKEYKIIEQAARKLNLDFDEQNISFVHEFLFVVTRCQGKEQNFLKLWEQLGRFFEFNGMYDGEGHSIGLAAAKAGLSIRHDTMDNFEFFKDKIERVRIQKGTSDPETNRIYFDMREKIYLKNSSLINKVVKKISKKLLFYYRSINLKVNSRIKSLEFEI